MPFTYFSCSPAMLLPRLLLLSLLALSSSGRLQKRFLWMTHEEKRLVMPPGSQLVLTPTLAMPLLREGRSSMRRQKAREKGMEQKWRWGSPFQACTVRMSQFQVRHG